MLYTSYFAKMKRFPSNMKCVSIARYSPQWYDGATCISLAPSPELLAKWKSDHNEEYYIDTYKRETLNRKDAATFVKNITDWARGSDVVFLCYERNGDFCHRHLVADWLKENGFPCEEWLG